MRNVVRTFPGVRAVDGVSFDVRRGEIHALIGENGAGKSTLMHLVAGVYQPDAGGRA
jgi:ribose transport system ATP-binding protein